MMCFSRMLKNEESCYGPEQFGVFLFYYAGTR
jgi:hypothetical protein